LFGVDWVMLRRVRELSMSWGGQVGRRDILELWRLVPLCLMWCIWRERNAQSFKDKDFGGGTKKDYIQFPLHIDNSS
jgi:hypothetical protein